MQISLELTPHLTPFAYLPVTGNHMQYAVKCGVLIDINITTKHINHLKLHGAEYHILLPLIVSIWMEVGV